MLKGPKRSFVVVVVLVLGVKSKAKNVPNGKIILLGNKKCSEWNKNCAREQKMFLKSSVVSFGIELPCLPCMA